MVRNVSASRSSALPDAACRHEANRGDGKRLRRWRPLMRLLNAAGFAGVLLLSQLGRASAQAKAAKAFLLEDASSNQWCAYAKEADWNAAVQDAGAMTVAPLTYSDDHLLQIDVTETDETGDWTVYDHFFLDDRGRIVRLSRLINVLPGDRSVLQEFSISDGRANRTAITETQLSTVGNWSLRSRRGSRNCR